MQTGSEDDSNVKYLSLHLLLALKKKLTYSNKNSFIFYFKTYTTTRFSPTFFIVKKQVTRSLFTNEGEREETFLRSEREIKK
jgi:hypothetical protein